MIEHPCNCYNKCPHYEDKGYGMVCKLDGEEYGLTKFYVKLLMRCGCNSHPFARVILIQPIIEELKLNKSMYGSSCHDDGDKGTIMGLDIAITILIEGEKK